MTFFDLRNSQFGIASALPKQPVTPIMVYYIVPESLE
jgi:hypothetical protein